MQVQLLQTTAKLHIIVGLVSKSAILAGQKSPINQRQMDALMVVRYTLPGSRHVNTGVFLSFLDMRVITVHVHRVV